jgi:hypothetical protein
MTLTAPMRKKFRFINCSHLPPGIAKQPRNMQASANSQ